MHSAVDLFKSLQTLLQDWPQLLKDFAAFLLPEQALSCGLVSHFGGQRLYTDSRAEAEGLECSQSRQLQGPHLVTGFYL